MSKIGIIVDGPGDFVSLKKRFRDNYRILKTDGPRGHTASIEDIVAGAHKQISMLEAFDCANVIVLVDFEMRTRDYNSFLDEMQASFTRCYTTCSVKLAVPNRMIENWYLADIEHLSKNKVYLKNNLRKKHYDGSHGKEIIKTCFVKGHSYSETTHGPDMFEILRFDMARSNSPSFNRFLLITENRL